MLMGQSGHQIGISSRSSPLFFHFGIIACLCGAYVPLISSYRADQAGCIAATAQ